MKPPNNGTFNPTVGLCNPIHIYGKIYTPFKGHYILLSKNIVYPCQETLYSPVKECYVPLSRTLYTPVKYIIYPCHETLCSLVMEHYIPVMKHYVPLS